MQRHNLRKCAHSLSAKKSPQSSHISLEIKTFALSFTSLLLRLMPWGNFAQTRKNSKRKRSKTLSAKILPRPGTLWRRIRRRGWRTRRSCPCPWSPCALPPRRGGSRDPRTWWWQCSSGRTVILLLRSCLLDWITQWTPPWVRGGSDSNPEPYS